MKHSVFQCFVASEVKAAGAEPFGQMRDQNLRAAAARSRFWRQNAQNASLTEHFWKRSCRKSVRGCGAKRVWKSNCWSRHTLGPLWRMRCQKSARRCGAKHISKSKCTKHTRVGALFWKLWCRKSARRCGAKHFRKSKLGPLSEVRVWFCVAGAMDSAPCQAWAKGRCLNCVSSKRPLVTPKCACL